MPAPEAGSKLNGGSSRPMPFAAASSTLSTASSSNSTNSTASEGSAMLRNFYSKLSGSAEAEDDQTYSTDSATTSRSSEEGEGLRDVEGGGPLSTASPSHGVPPSPPSSSSPSVETRVPGQGIGKRGADAGVRRRAAVGSGSVDEEDEMRPGGAPRKKRSWALRTYARACYLCPLGFMVGLLLLFALVASQDRPLCLVFLTVYVVHHAWCHLYHVAVFSGIGQARMWRSSAYNYRVDRDSPPVVDFLADQGGGRIAWGDVLHCVLIPNYKEDADILREAIDSCARSSVAKNQMVLVLAFEARELNVETKARELVDEYSSKFLHVLSTFHPADLPNETPGKSSNTRWAAQKLWAFADQKKDWNQDALLLTISDADSDFHVSYFEALTTKFCSVGKLKRERTIWQAPILHYKNYHTQPAIVALTSMFVAQHELANLADPSSTALPYSSYSVSSNLARFVGGWDPDWISEDWHMFLKCFLNTRGEVSVEGIFLPVVNYTPEDVTYTGSLIARWEQAKRHALGISEMVYFLSSLPDVYSACPTLAHFAYFFYRGTLVMYKILATHIEQGTYWILGSLNGPLLWWVYNHPGEASAVGPELRTQVLRFNIAFSMVSTFVFLMFNALNVSLYRGIRPRIVPFPDTDTGGRCCNALWKFMYGNPLAYYLFLMVSTLFLAPLLGIAGGVTAWRAAIKTAKSHKFEYVVALKPQAAKNRPGAK